MTSHTAYGFDNHPNRELFAVGDQVTATEGPFAAFDGTVIEVDLSLGLAIVEIPLFGK